MNLKSIWAYLSPINFLRCRTGYCFICCRHSFFLMNEDLSLVRGHAVCIWCRSRSRHRHLAKSILESFKSYGITRLSKFKSFENFAIYNTTTTGPIVNAIGLGNNIICSEFFDDCPSGQFRNGVLCQNLECLSFENEKFDLIISEDVFEHLQDYKRGFVEVHRVLKKGGVHAFTIPFHFGNKTKDLFIIQNEKKILIEPIEFHGDPIRGLIPCYTHFGYDLFDFLNSIGFETTLHISSFEDDVNFATFNSFTFISKKL